MTGLRAQLERARADKEGVEEALGEAQALLLQEQKELRALTQSRAREAEIWTDEREKSLSLVEEMTKEVKLVMCNCTSVLKREVCKGRRNDVP